MTLCNSGYSVGSLLGSSYRSYELLWVCCIGDPCGANLGEIWSTTNKWFPLTLISNLLHHHLTSRPFCLIQELVEASLVPNVSWVWERRTLYVISSSCNYHNHRDTHWPWWWSPHILGPFFKWWAWHARYTNLLTYLPIYCFNANSILSQIARFGSKIFQPHRMPV